MIKLIKRIIQILLDFLFPTTNFVTKNGDVVVTKNHKLFNVKGE